MEVYHGTGSDFISFNKNKVPKNYSSLLFGWGFYFTESERRAEFYASQALVPRGKSERYVLACSLPVREDKFLDWNKSIQEQSSSVIESMKYIANTKTAIGNEMKDIIGYDNFYDMTGENVFKMLKPSQSDQDFYKNLKKVSSEFVKSGIYGIIFNDISDVRDVDPELKNIAFFDVDRVKILTRKNAF